MPALDDVEGARVPIGVRVFDAHVHIFPDRVFDAIWRWFDAHAWSIRYRLYTDQVIEFLASRGVRRLVALHYAHKPGMAGSLNRFAAEAARAHPEIVAFGTIFPGENDARALLDEAFGPLGLRGIKLHCHVQRMAADDPRLDVVYAACADADRPVVIHSGREPSMAAYGVDTRALCAAAQIDRVLTRHPTLTLVVPHLGFDEIAEYAALLDRHERLWLDTTMVIGGYFPVELPYDFLARHADRLLYGTDFPNIPYAWDRELKALLAAPLDAAQRDAILWGNAERLFGG